MEECGTRHGWLDIEDIPSGAREMRERGGVTI